MASQSEAGLRDADASFDLARDHGLLQPPLTGPLALAGPRGRLSVLQANRGLARVAQHRQGRLPRAGLILFVALLLFGGLLIAWIVERVEDFQARVAQGFSAFRDRPYYLTRVIPFQVLDWTLRIATVFFFLRAFQIPGTLHNALLV